MTGIVADAELDLAATSLMRSVLALAPGERFVAVGDAESSRILDALEKAAKQAGGEPTLLRLDRLRSHSTNHTGERPHKVLPDAVRRAILSAQASVFVASAPHAELSMRDQLLHVSMASAGRHVHMPATSELAFARGVRADFDEIRAEGRALERTLEVAKEITCESEAGTKLSVQTGVGRRWVSRFGNVRPGECVQLPAGSLMTCAETVSGTFVADASVGEYFGARAGLLAAPVTFEIVNGTVMNVLAPHSAELARDIETMLHVAPNSDRVGLVVIGLNVDIGEATGDAEVDQHRLGLHLVFGDPVGRLTGASWSARTTFAACQKKSLVRVDGVLVG